MSFLWKAIGLSDSVPGFPYTARDNNNNNNNNTNAAVSSITATTSTLTWTMRPGVSDDNGRPVTIFSINLAKADESIKEMARNAMKRAKSLLLPGLLRCSGAVEYQETIYIATEPCEPLSTVLQQHSHSKLSAYTTTNKKGSSDGVEENEDEEEDDNDAFLESVALGLKTVGTALVALHHNNFIHGNVACESVYVLPSGEWRLFGLELVSVFGEAHSMYDRYAARLPEYRRPPETLHTYGGNQQEQQQRVGDTDAWGLACLIYDVLGRPENMPANSCTANDMRGCRSLPRTLQSGFVGLCTANPKMRHDVDRFLRNSTFIVGSEFVKCMQALDELSLKDNVERERFFDHLSSVVDTFPKKACMRLVLPKLQASFNFGALPAVIDPVLRIAARLANSPEEYATYVAPVLVSLFASQDRMVRYRLLQRAPEYASLLPANVVNDQIWPLLVSGFSSPVPGIREYTIRALVSFAKNLQEKILLNDVPKYVGQLQQDQEGAIRTNATIGLCLMADMIPAEQRSKILIHGFGRMLRDPFVPSRVGALRSFQSTLKYLTPQHIAELMLPGVGPLTVDSVGEVRQAALLALRGAIERLEVFNSEESVKEAKTSMANSGVNGATDTTPDKNNSNNNENKTASSSSFWGWRWGAGGNTSENKSDTTPVGGTTIAFGTNTTTTTNATSTTTTATSSFATGASVHTGSNVKNLSVPIFTNTTTTKTTMSSPTVTSELEDNSKDKNNSHFDDDDDDDPWGNDVDFAPVKTRTPATTTATSMRSAERTLTRHVDTNSTMEPASGSRAMKLRKKGLGASRLS
ncbi:SCY1 family protein kinase [Trypanosoma theileri]|uniref:SCY1 family protein kinase n=1 Tax=Trypanosoma theileri TaxID=67003 RepID=A0A1X0NY37_9TRYP|nr:SCY1 family protein kinase [Trypanosoma theileri]ORC89468.1 SCY1 family protein kinase [Trypanosoma theileri]